MRSGCGHAAPRTTRPSAAGWRRRGRNSPTPRGINIKSPTTTWTRPWPNFARSSPESLRGPAMLDDLKEEGIVHKVGGRFKLSTLIQKRMVALNTGARPLVDIKGGDKMTIVIQEILQDKIYLDMSGQLQLRDASAGEPARRAMLTDVSDVGSGED